MYAVEGKRFGCGGARVRRKCMHGIMTAYTQSVPNLWDKGRHMFVVAIPM